MDLFPEFISSINGTNRVPSPETISQFQLQEDRMLYFLPLNSLEKINIQKGDIVVHEDIWLSKTEVVKSRIKSILGLNERVFARKTKTRLLSKKECHDFYSIHHLNMPLTGAYNYGLFLNNELLSAISFSRPCPIHRNGMYFKKSHVLLRFCTKINTNIIGGLSKLIQHFIKEQKPDDLMTHIDIEWSDGSGFKKLGFTAFERTPAHILYLDPVSFHRYNEKYIPSELIKEDLLPVYNHGSIKLVLELNGVPGEKR